MDRLYASISRVKSQAQVESVIEGMAASFPDGDPQVDCPVLLGGDSIRSLQILVSSSRQQFEP